MFDAQTEKLNESPVWVKLPGLPLQFWFDSVFTSIGNTLGKFLDFDKYFEQTDDLSVARILVILNPREGLAEAMTLKYRELEFVQKLDYENLPFRCHRCHIYGHLAKECPLGHRRRRNPLKVPRKPAVFPVSNTGMDIPKEPMEEDLEEGLEVVTSSAPLQQIVSARSLEQAPMLTASQVTPTAGKVGASQVGMPLSFLFSLCLSDLDLVSTVSMLGTSRQLQMEFSCLNLNSPPVDSLVVSVPSSSGDPPSSKIESLLPCHSLDSAPSSTAPPYNLRSLAFRPGKEIIPGGREQDLVPIGPRKTRGRKSNMSKAKQKAIIDIVDGKHKSLTGVLRAAKPPSNSLK